MKRFYIVFVLYSLIVLSSFGQGCWKKVEAGKYGTGFTVGLTNDGRLFAWGINSHGELGIGNNINQSIPTQVGTSNTWKTFAVGESNVLAIKQDGTLWAWGNYIALGKNSSSDSYIPVQVNTETDWKDVFSGDFHVFALKNNGTLWATGNNGYGQCGDGTTTNKTTFVQIGTDTDWKQISGGNLFSVGLKQDGSLFTWGNNSNGQCGNGTWSGNVLIPTKLGNNFVAVSAGRDYVLALKNDGSLFAWGSNPNSQLGDGTIVAKNIPIQVGSDYDWKQISAGRDHNTALKQDGSLWVWGRNYDGSLGLGYDQYQLGSSKYPYPNGTSLDWKDTDCGGFNCVAIKNDGSLYAWGDNSNGQIGNGTNSNLQLTPLLIDCPVTLVVNYTISILSLPSNGGTTTGSGSFASGQSCTVTATANTGYTFTNWTENGTVVSTSASFTFSLSANRVLVANFIQNGENYHSVGYSKTPGSETKFQLDKILTKISDSIYTTTISYLNNSYGVLCLNIHKTNTVSFENSYYTGNYTITATKDSVNSFDPVLRKFDLHYQYTPSSGTRYIREKLSFFLTFNLNKIKYTTLNNTEVELTKGDSCQGTLNIPQTVSYNNVNYNVVTIANSAFLNDTLLTSVVLPNTIRSIGINGFNGCRKLTSINLPNALKSIGDWAFQWTSITSLTIPSSVDSLGYNPFECGNLSTLNVSVGNSMFKCIDGVLFNNNGTRLICCIQSKSGVYEIPNSVTIIGNESFGLCSKLTSAIVPNSVTTIEDGAFQECINLTSLTIPSTVKTIGAYIFSGCVALNSITLPPTITTIGYYTFRRCTSLTNIAIPESITTIDSYAFGGCTGLNSIFIPAAVNSITGYNPFADCNLSSIQVHAGNTSFKSVEGALFSIDGSSLISCVQSKVGSYEIPNSVNTIGAKAFGGCKQLTSLTIPSSVNSIQFKPFLNCSQLSSLKVLALTPPTSPKTSGYLIGNLPTTIPVYIPQGTLAAYKAASGWSDFLNLTESTATNQIQSDNIHIALKDGEICITGLNAGTFITVVDLQGKLFVQQQATGDIYRIMLPAKGVYLVRIAEKTTKVIY